MSNKCPHCGYEPRPENPDWAAMPKTEQDRRPWERHIDAKEGSFFVNPVQMEQPVQWDGPRRVALLGCPKCHKVFIDD